jgi:glutamate dehydrogenase (NAD(P)+)
VAVQGFGAVGGHAARFLADPGGGLVAASDSAGAVVNPEGLDVAGLTACEAEGGSVAAFPGGSPIPRDELLGGGLRPAGPGRPPRCAHRRQRRAGASHSNPGGANIPATGEAEQRLHKRGVLVVPDIIANAGGVICAAVEHQGGTQAQALALVQETVGANTTEVLRQARELGILPREAAEELARARITEATGYRHRW